MKEQLHTIPISDAMANAGECPFCYIERKTEEHMMDFVLGHGASYMEADIRDMTDREGFCLDHFKVLCEGADEILSDKERKDFYDTMLPLMRENVERVYEDVAWFVEKYDYKNRDADWKNSKDAIQRGMQKLRGSDPSLPPHVLKK